jgi:multidrug efflux system membrane fusion protein
VYAVEVTIPNPRNQLKSGMIASLALNGDILPGSVLAVPLSAVIRDPQNPQGFAVLTVEGQADPATVRSRSVDLGDAYGNMIQVQGGVKGGERVVTAGSTLVRSGDKVRVIQ